MAAVAARPCSGGAASAGCPPQQRLTSGKADPCLHVGRYKGMQMTQKRLSCLCFRDIIKHSRKLHNPLFLQYMSVILKVDGYVKPLTLNRPCCAEVRIPLSGCVFPMVPTVKQPQYGAFPKSGGPFWGFLVIRTIIQKGLHWVSPYFWEAACASIV